MTLDKKNYRIDLPDDPRRHQFVNAMQFAGAQFKAIVPNRASAIGHVEQSHADLEAPPIARERSIDDVVELAPLQQRLAREGNRGAAHERYRRNHVEPAKTCQRRGYFLAEGNRQAFLARRSRDQERQNADTKPMLTRGRRRILRFSRWRQYRRDVALILINTRRECLDCLVESLRFR